MRTSREVSRRCGGDRGASLLEYSLLLTMITIICVGVVTLLGLPTTLVFDNARDGFERTAILGPPDTTPEDSGGGPGATVPDCSTTTTVPGDSGPDCTTTTTAGP